jgi:tRNA dimethylallyltransferase
LNKTIILAGPTASGKTEVAFEISKLIPCEMISCDSMQVYRSMPLVTQAPSKKITRKLKTHLVSFLDPSKEYNAACFRKDAGELILKIQKKKKTPLIVGGTGLYFRALLDGLFEAGESELSKDEALRNKLLAEQDTHGGGYLHKKLEEVDPASAKKIHPNDLRRTVRALEVFHLTGKPMSAQKSNRRGVRSDLPHSFFFLERDREDLYARINHRVELMLKEGLVDEVRKLRKKKLSLTAMMALGVREVEGYLKNEYSLEEAVRLLKQHTRNYAKRQLSWFRHEKGVEVIQITKDESASDVARKILLSFRARAEGPSREIL